MKTALSTPLPRNERVHGRQIAFAAAFLLPISKFLEVPSLLAQYAAGDLLVPALLHFLLQSLVLAALLYAATRSETPLIERLHNALGKWTIAVYIFFGIYFLYAAVIPLLDLDKFVYAAFFDTEPTFFSFGLFFLLSAFICTKGLKAVGRSADLCLFLFVIPFLALIVMSLWETDFSHLLPLFGTKFGDTMSSFTYTTPQFSDAVLLLPLISCSSVDKKDAKKIMTGYWIGALCVLTFLAVFFGTYSSLAPREHYAFAKIAQYFPALAVVGRIDLIFIYLLTVVLLFYTCLPLQYATDLFARTLKTNRRTWIAAALSLLGFLFFLFANHFYNSLYAFIAGIPLIFWLIADLIPLLCLLLPANDKKNKPSSSPNSSNANVPFKRKKENDYA